MKVRSCGVALRLVHAEVLLWRHKDRCLVGRHVERLMTKTSVRLTTQFCCEHTYFQAKKEEFQK
jgi:hypothetical protein